MNENIVNKIGWFASCMAIAMYASYIDQIRLNLSGQTGSIILPVVTTINCIAWTMYGALKIKKDWPIIVCNVPGIVLGIVTAVTAL
ncbi:MAG: hypothetical protein COU33_02675 [Candidatus Magasanikbacteria bacterium CG10_big_fil_rev_8_21_14_0_10_43_6]|uniref:ABC transporter permease n=1 Tax=Candidatus Magasanikbacteria bacterium CG10_big_fil_rev_8_21_14_0_10_43_6 TaxID=1974650 RepID=A0A2M6W144_9BACT|nr:MAG: hypothetical protein COU33_02675 [Candidatus Magasanikbacteria bacterium CG10_big_fil_rev_8_21_14_0_10_43_6]